MNHKTKFRAITVGASVAFLVGSMAGPAQALTIISPATTTSAHYNPIQGCWVRYAGDRASDTAYAYDEYNTCLDTVGARMWYQPNGPVGVQTTSVKWDPNYAVTISANDFREAKGYYKF